MKKLHFIGVFIAGILGAEVPTGGLGVLAGPPGSFQRDGNSSQIRIPLRFQSTVYWTRYFSKNPDFGWDGGVQTHLELLRWERGILYFFGDIETIIEKSRQVGLIFNPRKAHYTLEPGIRMAGRRFSLEVAWDHHSKHDEDRFDGLTERWNTLGLRFRGRSILDGVVVHHSFFAGKVVGLGRTDVDYQGEMTIRCQISSLGRNSLSPFVSAAFRLVFTDGSIASRRHFMDGLLEGGVRIKGDVGWIAFYIGVSHFHDADRCGGQTETLGTIGVRLGQ